jgi:hypothetical protein
MGLFRRGSPRDDSLVYPQTRQRQTKLFRSFKHWRRWPRRAHATGDPAADHHGDLLAVIDDRIAAEPDPKAHPLDELVNFLLDRQTAVDGAAFYNRCRQLCLAAIDTCLDDLLELED